MTSVLSFDRDYVRIQSQNQTSSSAMVERPCKLGDVKLVGHFENKFYVEGLHFAPISMNY